jgi:hypothetical protein
MIHHNVRRGQAARREIVDEKIDHVEVAVAVKVHDHDHD